MLKFLEKHAPTILFFLLIVLIVALFFSPPSARLLSTIIIVFGIGTAILFTIHNNWEKHKEGELTRSEFVRNTILDLLGLALVMSVAVWLGRLTGTYIGLAWGNVAGIVVAMVVGLIAAFFVGKVWAKIAEPMKTKATAA